MSGPVVCRSESKSVRLAARVGLLVLLSLSLAACGGGDNEPTPVPTTEEAAPAPTSAPIGAPPSPSGAGSIVGDGICQVRAPASWIEESPGSGVSPSGGRFVVHGNRLSSAATWENAAALFTSQLEDAGATVEDGDGWVRGTYPNERGFAFRARFDDRWCDVRLTGRGGALPANDAREWPAIEASLVPVE